MNIYFKQLSGVNIINYIYFWKSKALSNENIAAPNTSDLKLNPELSYLVLKQESNGSYLKQDKITYNHGKVVNIYIVYEISKNFNSDYPTLEKCLFVAVNSNKNVDIDKYKYSGYGIGFDRHRFYSHPSSGTGRNVIIFGVDMSSSTKTDNRKKDILILGKGPIQGLEHTMSAEKKYSINFTGNNKKFCLSLHYHGENSYLLVNSTETHKFKENDSEIVATPLCPGKISKNNMII